MQLAAQIYDRIALEVPDFDRSKTYRVDFYGAHEFQTAYPEIKHSTLAASFFEWDGGNPYRIAVFMNVMGYSNIEALDPATRKAFLPEIQTMPIWPQRGSVKVVEDVVLVRLGKEPGSTHLSLIDAP